MTRRLTVRHESWPLERPFAISRGVKTAADVVIAEVAQDGVVGWGECVPYPRYGESVDSVRQQLQVMSDDIEAGADAARINEVMPASAARNALDCALWDLRAKLEKTSVADLLGISNPQPEITAETIGIGSPDEMGKRAEALSRAPLLKIKLDGKEVEARLDAVRAAAPDARLIVDPNEGWDVDLLSKLSGYLFEIGVEMLEQPVPAGDDGGLANIDIQVPVCADEAVHTTDGLEDLRGRYDMINIKLDKTGGLTEAMRLKSRALELGFGVMVGCMVGTSLSMAPAVLVAQGAKIVDLDGPLLLKDDRIPGLDFTNGRVHPAMPGLWG